MKTLRQLVAVALLVGSYNVGMAQDKGTSNVKLDAKETKELQEQKATQRFSSDAEKREWIKANPEKYKAEKAESKARGTVKTTPTTAAQPRVRTNKAAPVRTIPANAQRSTTTLSESKSGEKANTVQKKTVAKESSAKRTDRMKVSGKEVNNTSKALPADYRPTENGTKTEQK